MASQSEGIQRLLEAEGEAKKLLDQAYLWDTSGTLRA